MASDQGLHCLLTESHIRILIKKCTGPIDNSCNIQSLIKKQTLLSSMLFFSTSSAYFHFSLSLKFVANTLNVANGYR